MTKSEYDRAHLRGWTDGQVGRKTNPYQHRPGREGDLLRSAWEAGHAAQRNPETAHGVD